MVALKLYWLHEHGDNPVIVETPAELRGALNLLHRLSLDGRVIAQAMPSGGKPTAFLDIGLHGEWGALHYSGRDYREGCFSKGDTYADAPELLYYYMNSDTEYPPDAEISSAAVRRAAEEFMTTGKRPTSVEWQPRPERTKPEETDWPV
jgi:immunity protein Imm1 of predicted polymorphic toxin system